MNKNLKKTMLAVLTVLMVIMLFAACDMDTPQDTNLLGKWVSDGGVITITNSTYANDNEWSTYSGDIVDFSNSGFNVDETSNYDTYGFVLVTLTKSTSIYTPVGTCFVLRWENMVTTDGVTTVSLCEGYSAEPFTDTAAALTGMTAVDGNFYSYSTSTKSEE